MVEHKVVGLVGRLVGWHRHRHIFLPGFSFWSLLLLLLLLFWLLAARSIVLLFPMLCIYILFFFFWSLLFNWSSLCDPIQSDRRFTHFTHFSARLGNSAYLFCFFCFFYLPVCVGVRISFYLYGWFDWTNLLLCGELADSFVAIATTLSCFWMSSSVCLYFSYCYLSWVLSFFLVSVKNIFGRPKQCLPCSTYQNICQHGIEEVIFALIFLATE